MPYSFKKVFLAGAVVIFSFGATGAGAVGPINNPGSDGPTGNPAVKIIFITVPPSTPAGTASGNFKIQRFDAAGTPTTTDGQITIALSSSGTGGIFTPTSVTIASGQSTSGGFTYKNNTAGTYTLTASSPGLFSGTVQYSVTQANNPAPVLSVISPVSTLVGSPGFLLRVTGTGFIPSSVIYLQGSPLPTNYSGSSTDLSAFIPTFTVANTYKITVVNPLPGGGTSNPLSLIVSKANPSITTVLAPATINVGGTASDGAVLSNTTAWASGTVAYKIYKDVACSIPFDDGGSVQVALGTVPNSREVIFNTPGTYYWQAKYSGDINNSPASSLCGSEILIVRAIQPTTGSLALIKNTAGGDGVFGFSDNFNKVISLRTVNGSAQETFLGLTPAADYNLYETAEVGWRLDSVACYIDDNKTQPTGIISLAAGGVTRFSVVAGKTTYCYFVNTKKPDTPSKGTIIIKKITVNGDDVFNFATTGTAPGWGGFSINTKSTPGRGSFSQNVLPGTYSATEVVPINWNLASAICDQNSNPNFIQVTAGKTTTCTFTDIYKASPSIYITPTPNPVAVGTIVSIGTQLKNVTATAGGNVIYKVYTNSTCTEGEETTGIKPVSNGVTTGYVFTFTKVGTGKYFWQATYSGDTANKNAVSNCALQNVTTITKNNPSISTVLIPGTAVPVGTAVYDTTKLTGATSSAEGTVTYTIYSDQGCSVVAQAMGSVSVANGKIPNSNPLTFTKKGTYYWQVDYSGDKYNDAAKSPCTSEILKVGDTPPDTPTADKGSIKIVVKTIGGDSTFNYQSNFAGAFALATTGGGLASQGTASKTTEGLVSGTYTISQTTPPAGWDLISFVCDNTSVPNAIKIDAGKTTTCTATNKLRLTCNAVPIIMGLSRDTATVGDDAFEFAVDGTGYIMDKSAIQINGVSFATAFASSTLLKLSDKFKPTTAGKFIITVTNPAPCGGTSNPKTLTINKGSTQPEDPPTNSGKGSVKITKKSNNGDGLYCLTATGPNNYSKSFCISTSGGTNSETLADLAPGQYAITEKPSQNAKQDSSTCGSVTVIANQTTACVVTNTITSEPQKLTITTIDPFGKAECDSAHTMAVTGTGFMELSKVRVEFKGVTQDLPTTYSSATKLTADISGLNTAGSYKVSVANPDGAVSNSLTFSVNPGNTVSPTVSSINPETKKVGDSTFAMAVTGADFSSNSIVNFENSSRPTTFVSVTKLTVQIPATDLEVPGKFNIWVSSPGQDGKTCGKGNTNTLPFTVTSSDPDNPPDNPPGDPPPDEPEDPDPYDDPDNKSNSGGNIPNRWLPLRDTF